MNLFKKKTLLEQASELQVKLDKAEKEAKVQPPVLETITEVEKNKAPNRVEYEIFKESDKRLIVVRKGKISKARAYLIFKQRQYYTDHILKQSKKGKRDRYFIRWNLFYSEALDSIAATEPKFSAELENDLMTDLPTGLKRAVITLAGMHLDRTTILLLLLAFVFGHPIGFSYNDIFHWVPNTVVHWVRGQ